MRGYLARIVPVSGADGYDPEYGIPEGAMPGWDLPSGGHPWVPGHLPKPPAGVWPPPNSTLPIVPAPPGTPPGAIWPPVEPPVFWPRPPQGPPPQGGPPPTPGTPLPPPSPTTFWVVAGIPGVGWRYVCVDVSVRPGDDLPNAPVRPDHGLPPTEAQPRGTR